MADDGSGKVTAVTVELFNSKMDVRLQRKRDNEALETRMEVKNENKTRKVPEDLAFMKDKKTVKMRSHCTVSSAASTVFGLGSGTHPRPPPFSIKAG